MKSLFKKLVWFIPLLGICLELPGLDATSSQAGENNTAGKSIFKSSHVPAWFDGMDNYKRYDVDVIVQDMDVVDEIGLQKWKDHVDRLHKQGKLFCAELSPVTHMDKMLEYAMNEPGMQNAVCLDLDRKPIPISWMAEHPYKGRIPNFYCSNHPRYRAFLRQQIYMYTEVGVDGVMVDDGGGAFFAYGRGGCFCKYCMAAFREYLKNKYTTEQLRRKGIDDPDAFDYHTFVLQRAADVAAYKKARRQGKIPWNEDFQDFLIRSDAALFRSLQQMASKLSGRYIPMGWDNVDFGGSRAPYYPFLDVFYSEINYQRFSVDGRGPDEEFPPGIIMLNKLSDALGKWYTPTPAPRSWGAIMEKNLTGLLRQWIAFSYANGGPVRYPRKGWVFSTSTPWYYPPKDQFEPLYDFVRKHRSLFDDYEAVEQVGVLFTQNRSGGGSPYYSPLKHACSSLVNSNIPFGMAVAGDELLSNRLDGNEAARFEVMLIPEPIRLVDGQQQIVERWRKQGKAISVRLEDNVAKKLRGRIKPLMSLESEGTIWLFPRRIRGKPDASLVCHLVNGDYDSRANRIVPRKNVKVRLSRRLIGTAQAKKTTYFTIGKKAQLLEMEARDDGLHVVVPELGLWGILKIEI